MPKYQEIIYGSGVVYGEAARLSFSAEPVTAVALSHSTIQVTWAKPANTIEESYIGFRIVRNQDAFPETEEDGVILYEFFTTTDALVDETSFIDGEEEVSGLSKAPLVSGRFAYYRAWILLAENGEWVRAGDAYTLLPDPHYSGTGPDTVASQWSTEFDEVADFTIGNQRLTTTHSRLMDLIPRVYLSANQGPLDAIREYDPNIDDTGPTDNVFLNQFLKGFSLTADEILTYAELIAPEITGRNTDPNILKLQSHQLNLSFDTSGISRTQKKMVREAMYTYRRKGTLAGLQTVVESLTGYDVSLYPSANLMLSPQDSTFYKGLGFWNAGTGCTIQSIQAVAAGPDVGTPDLEDSPLAIDFEYSANVKVTTLGASIYNGYVNPITRGIPVTAGLSYTLSFWANYEGTLGSGDALATASIRWFDRNGNLISTITDADPSNAHDDWVVQTLTATAPTNAVYAGLGVSFNKVSDLWYLDMFQFEQNSSFTTFQEARGISVILNPKKVNYILDPSFEFEPVESSPWTFDNGTVSTTSLISGGGYDGPVGARSGLKKAVFVSDSSGECVISTQTSAQTGGRFYAFSIYAKSDEDVTATISLLDSDERSTEKEITITSDWQRFYVTHYFLNEGPSLGPAIEVIITGTFAGATIELDCAQLEESYYPTDYFDGSLTNVGGAWFNGVAANYAQSVMYPGINTKLTRLANEIEKYLPINTPYRVEYTKNSGAMNPPRGIS
jgi:hypothetical protein